MGHPVLHFEIGGADIAETAEFYRLLFGWTIGEEESEGFRLIEAEEDSIGGGLMRTPPGVPAYVTIYVGVEDLGAHLERAEQLGGKVLVEPTPIPGVGAFALIRDPQEAVIGLFEDATA